MKLRWMALLALVLVGQLLAAVRTDTPAEAEKRLLKDLQFLTSDDCEGRGIYTKGINAAADYIAREFEKAGLKPAGKTFFQPFTLTTGAKAGKNNRLSLRGPLGQTIDLERDRHFAVLLTSPDGKVGAPLVFAGYGITSEKPKYDDYAGLDVKDKVVVVLSGTPRQAGLFDSRTSSQDHKVSNAARRGAAAVLLVNGVRPSDMGGRPGRGGPRTSGRDPFPTASRFTSLRSTPATVPLVFLKRDWLDRMLVATKGCTLEEVEKEIDAGLAPRSTPLSGWTCQLQTDVARTTVTVKNVVGVLEGAGPLANQTVIVGAHYDHVGMGSGRSITPAPPGGGTPPGGTPQPPPGRGRGGVAGPGAPGGVGFPTAEGRISAVHHGADDNASGTVTVLELARRFGAMKNREGRRLIFIAFTAEESGLIGSAHYCGNPLFPLADTVAMINMDMVGRLQDDQLLVSGLGTAKLFPGLVERLNSKHRFKLNKENAGNGPSDHSSFFNASVPVLNLFTGFHEQYHRPTDRYETINVPGLRRVADLVTDLMDELSRSKERPQFVRATGSFDRTKTLWAMAPSTGILPKYLDNRDGLLIDGVVNQTAAAKAGLKKGDRIIAAAGKPIRDPATFLELSRAWKPGEKVDLTILRDGKETKVPLQLAQVSRGGFGTPRIGFTLRPVEGKEGLYVSGLVKDGPAARAGLRDGDRVLSLNKQAMQTAQDFFRAAIALREATTTEVVVEREGKKVSVTLKLP